MTLGNPAALWGLLLAAPLVALYVLRADRRRIRVPSLLFWGAVVRQRRQARPWERFRRHALLWWQLLALITLVLALAEPSLPSRSGLGSSVVFVLDTSASMEAAAPPPSRWVHAQDIVRNALRKMGPFDEAALITTGPQPAVLVPPTRDRDRLRAVLDSLLPSQAEGRLEEAARLSAALLAARPGRSVVIVTDGSDPSLGPALIDLPQATVTTVGRGVPNVGITAVAVRRPDVAELDAELFVSLRRWGGDDAPRGIELWVDGELVRGTTLSVPADGPATWTVPGLHRDHGDLLVRLVPGDSFALDDEAHAILRPPRLRRIACRGCSPLTRRALRSDGRFLLDDPGPPDVIVSEAQPWPTTPEAPVLLLGGPAEPSASPLWPVVTAWSSDHPALRHVDPSSWRIGRASPRVMTGWETLIESDQGPLLAEGVLAGRRALALHLDPMATDLPMRVAWPLFLLSAVEHLSQRRDDGTGSVRAGEALVVERSDPEGTEIVAQPPGGPTRRAAVHGGVARLGLQDRLGFWTLQGPAGDERWAVHLGSEAEGDLRIVGRDDDRTDETAIVGTNRRPIQREILALLCLVLLGEWWTWRRTEAQV